LKKYQEEVYSIVLLRLIIEESLEIIPHYIRNK